MKITLKKILYKLTNLFCLAFEIKASAFLETQTKEKEKHHQYCCKWCGYLRRTPEAANSIYLERHRDLPHRRVIIWKTLEIINNNKTIKIGQTGSVSAVPFIRSFISVVWNDCGIFISSILKTRSTVASNLFRLASISFIRSWAVPVKVKEWVRLYIHKQERACTDCNTWLTFLLKLLYKQLLSLGNSNFLVIVVLPVGLTVRILTAFPSSS